MLNKWKDPYDFVCKTASSTFSSDTFSPSLFGVFLGTFVINAELFVYERRHWFKHLKVVYVLFRLCIFPALFGILSFLLWLPFEGLSFRDTIKSKDGKSKICVCDTIKSTVENKLKLKECVRFASFNISSCIGTDGKENVIRTANAIKKLNCEVIALQGVEMNKKIDQVALLSQLAGYQYTAFLSTLNPSKSGGYGDAILSKLQIVEQRDISQRGCVFVKIKTKSKFMWLGSSHLQNDITGYENIAQLKVISKTLQNLPLCVVGIDSNLSVRKLISTSKSLNLVEHLGVSYPSTFPASCPLLRRDGFVSSATHDGIINLSVTEEMIKEANCASWDEATQCHVSDHRPVLALLKIV